MNELDRNVLVVKDRKNRLLLPKQHIDKKVKKAIIDMMDGIKTFETHKFEQLDKQQLNEVARVAELPDPIFKSESELAHEKGNKKLKEKYEIVKGIVKAGNNSPYVKNELNKIYDEMHKRDMITPSQYKSNFIII